MEWNIPRIVVAATQSGGGKTTLVTGLLAALRAKGLTVQSFKVGPDYIDLGYHRMASGRAGHNLDTWLVPESRLTEIFARECAGADVAVIEGVMGLYDGGRKGISSTASIAKALNAPVLLVIDAKSVGTSAAATALGFRVYDEDVRLAGVLINRLGSETHEEMIRTAMAGIDMPVFGALRRNAALALPERHLGLTPVEENEAAETVRAIGVQVETGLDIARILELARSAPPLDYVPGTHRDVKTSCRIGIARDDAFSFYYAASLAELEGCGTQLVPFSPLHDEGIPDVDGLIISGYMYRMSHLVDFAGTSHQMAGVFPGTARMTEKLQMVGYVDAVQTMDTVFGAAGLPLHGHEFHFSVEEADAGETAQPFIFTKMRNGAQYPAGRIVQRTLGSYLHLHFAGCPAAAASFVEACRTWDK